VGGVRAPWTFRSSYLVGGLALSLFVPPALRDLAFVLAVYAVTGISHLGDADIGDAASGDREGRRRVLKDSALGVGGRSRSRSSCSGWRPPRSGLVEVAATAGTGTSPCDPESLFAAEVGVKARDGDARLRRGRTRPRGLGSAR